MGQDIVEACGLGQHGRNRLIQLEVMIFCKIAPDSTEIETRKKVFQIRVEDITLSCVPISVRINGQISPSLKSMRDHPGWEVRPSMYIEVTLVKQATKARLYKLQIFIGCVDRAKGAVFLWNQKRMILDCRVCLINLL